MKKYLLYLQLWIPFLLSVFICYQVPLSGREEMKALPAGFTAFLSFLPVVFFFLAQAVQYYVSGLEKRIVLIEEQVLRKKEI